MSLWNSKNRCCPCEKQLLSFGAFIAGSNPPILAVQSQISPCSTTEFLWCGLYYTTLEPPSRHFRGILPFNWSTAGEKTWRAKPQFVAALRNHRYIGSVVHREVQHQ